MIYKLLIRRRDCFSHSGKHVRYIYKDLKNGANDTFTMQLIQKLVDWGWDQFQGRSYDWTFVMDMIPEDQPRPGYTIRCAPEEIFFLFENKDDALITKLVHGGTYSEIDSPSIMDFLGTDVY